MKTVSVGRVAKSVPLAGAPSPLCVLLTPLSHGAARLLAHIQRQMS
jgi:hypothetical protein